jgi:PEP-CTERM motif
MMLKQKLIVTAIALLLSLGAVRTSYAVLVDIDGAAGILAPINVQQFDWGTTSFAAIGGGTAFTNFATANCGAGGGTGCDFTVLTHSRLVGVTPVGGSEFSPTGLNTSFEITMVAKFTETVIAPTTATTAFFQTKPSVPAVLEIYFDSTPNAVDVSGSGFNDGRLILTGSLVADAQGNFTVTSLTPVLLDQASPNDYGPTNAGVPTGADQQTVSGFGSQGNIAFDTLVTDPTFFLQILAQFGITFENISQGLPFGSINPSDCYTDTAAGVAVGTTIAERQCTPIHVDGLMSLQGADGLGGVVPVIGLINGAFGTAGGPDFIAQTDYNTFFTAAVTEPSSVLLLGVGLIGVSIYSRRKMIKK